jgi:hypothetical protein
MHMDNTCPPADGPQPAARPLADVMRELADHADNMYEGDISVHADTLRAWADEIEALRNTLLNVPSILKGCAQLADEAGSNTFADIMRWKLNQVQHTLGIAD